METALKQLQDAADALALANMMNAQPRATAFAKATAGALEAMAKKLTEFETALEGLAQASKGRAHG